MRKSKPRRKRRGGTGRRVRGTREIQAERLHPPQRGRNSDPRGSPSGARPETEDAVPLRLSDALRQWDGVSPEWRRPFLSLIDMVRKTMDDYEKAPWDRVVTLSNQLEILIRDRRAPRKLREKAEWYRDWLLMPYTLSPAFRKVRPRGPHSIPKTKDGEEALDEEALAMLETYESAWKALKKIFAQCSRAGDRFRDLAAWKGKDNVPPKGARCYRERPDRGTARVITIRKHNTTAAILKRRLARARKISRYRA